MFVQAQEEPGSGSEPKGRCPTLFWRFFPHVLLITSLILYAVLGAQIFKLIEDRNHRNESEAFHSMVHKIVETVQNHTGTSPKHDIYGEIESILIDFRDEKERYQNWTFYRSLFFSCTVFTTVGYGRMYPVTSEGKVACVLYAMVGIPLMLLVISDVGDVLAILLSKTYTRLTLFFKQRAGRYFSSRPNNQKISSTHQALSATEGTYTFNQDVVVNNNLNAEQPFRNPTSFRRTSTQLRNNKEFFDHIVVKESLTVEGALTKSCSCPDLNHITPSSDASKLFTSIGHEMEEFDVPLLVILLVVFAYMVVCSQILKCWETQMDHFDAFYFTFITLTTIGFGDIVPKHPNFFMITFLFIITGMAIMSMAFKLGQSQIVRCYRRCIKCLSMGRVGNDQDQENA